MKISTNLVTQIISIILLAFTASGLNIDANETATEIVKHFIGHNWVQLGLLFTVNLGGSFYQWFKTWRSNPAQLLTFLRSTNWWTSFGNMAVAIITGFGVLLPSDITGDALNQVVQVALTGNWKLLVAMIVGNVVNILIHRFTPNPAKEAVYTEPNTGAKIVKTSGKLQG